MFKEGELVMYGTIGVCQISKIGKLDFADDDALYYFLEPIYKSGTFYAPTDNSKISIRKMISKANARKLINSIEEIEPEIVTTSSVQQLSQHYQSVIERHTAKDLMHLIKSITAKEEECLKNNKKLGQIDRRFMKKAEELLYGELATALGKDREEVEKDIRDRM